MRVLAVVVLTVWMLPSAAFQAPESTVSGTVIADGTSIPLAGVNVGLASLRPQSTLTDAQGRFTFTKVPPGRYILNVRHDGYFALPIPGKIVGSTAGEQAYAETTVSVPLTLTAGQEVKNLVIKFVPGGIISGRVHTSTRTPLPNLKVAALQLVYDEGELKMINKREVTTDDRGEYRLFDLAPSEYYIEVLSSPRTYFPTAPKPGTAVRVKVTSGAEVIATDVTVPTVVGRSISGKLDGGVTLSRLPAFYLLPVDEWTASLIGDNPADSTFGIVPGASTIFDKASGHFELKNVPPGTYEVIARVFGKNNSAVQQGYFTAVQPIRVGDENISDIFLAFHANANIVGRVTPVSNSPTSLHIFLTPKDALLLRLKELSDSRMINVVVDRGGTFKLTNIYQGHYGVQVTGLPQNSYVADIRASGRSVLSANILTIEERPSDFEVVILSDGGMIDGVVQTANFQPVPSAKVVLISPSASGTQLVVYQNARSDAQGRFKFSAIAPGAYRILALQSTPPGAESNPEFLSTYEHSGQPVVIQSNGRNDVVLMPVSK